LDVSGDINFKEALYIGSILFIDSICAGFGYSIGNANILYFFIFVFIINIISISCGLALGGKVKYPKRNLKASLLPEIILITLRPAVLQRRLEPLATIILNFLALSL